MDKPEWMDGGVLQQRELENIQKLVKQNKSRNRKIYLREHPQKRRQAQEPESEANPTSSPPQHHASADLTPQSQSEEEFVVDNNVLP